MKQFSKRNFLKQVFFALFAMVIILSGCDKEEKERAKSIDKKLVGKWEMKSMTLDGIEYDLPYLGSPIGLSSAGYEYTTSTYKYFVNGNIFQVLSEVYSEDDQIYMSTGQSFGYTWKISDGILTLTRFDGISASMTCQKVSKFSWEK